MKTIDVSPCDLEIVRKILRRHLPEHDVWAFGSRVTGTAREFSDLDLAIVTETPVSATLLSDLRDAFRESDLPFKVDVLDWADTDTSFRKLVEKDHVLLVKGSRNARLFEEGMGSMSQD